MNSQKSYKVNLISKYRASLMGISIIGIVFCHLDIAQIRHNIETSHLAMIFHLFTVGVDIFMLLSAFGLYYHFYNKKPTSFFVYMYRRIKKILPKYLIIAGLTGIVSTIIIHKNGVIRLIEDLVFISWGKSGNTKYWFVAGIMILYILFPFIYKLLQTNRGESKLLLIVIAFLIITGVIEYSYPNDYSKFKILIERFPVFCLGAFLGKKSIEDIEYNKIFLLMISIIGYIGTFMQYISIKYNNFIVDTHFAYYFIRCFFALSIIITVILIMEIINKKAKRGYDILQFIFVYLGGITLEVYLFHQSYMILFNYPPQLLYYLIVAVLLPLITAIIIKKGIDFLKIRA